MNVLIWGERISQLGTLTTISGEQVELVNTGKWQLIAKDGALDLEPGAYVVVMQVDASSFTCDSRSYPLAMGNAYRLDIPTIPAPTLTTLEPGSMMTL